MTAWFVRRLARKQNFMLRIITLHLSIFLDKQTRHCTKFTSSFQTHFRTNFTSTSRRLHFDHTSFRYLLQTLTCKPNLIRPLPTCLPACLENRNTMASNEQLTNNRCCSSCSLHKSLEHFLGDDRTGGTTLRKTCQKCRVRTMALYMSAMTYLLEIGCDPGE